jgi:hypothetical protein
MTGGASPADSHMPGLAADFFTRSADAIAALIPDAERQTIDAQGHEVDAQAIAPVLREFFRR